MDKKFGRKKSNREHMERNLLTSLVLYEKIDTTKTKAKEISSSFDKLVRISRKSDMNSKQAVNKVLYDKNATKKLFEVIVPRYNSRNSGLTRYYKLYNKKGDNSEVYRLELIDSKKVENKKESTESKEVKEMDIKPETKKK